MPKETKKEPAQIAAAGGRARAEKMTATQRSESAKRAATARWNKLPRAVCGSPEKPLIIGDIEIQAYVLEDGTRLLTQGDFQEAMGRHRKANVRYEDGEEPTPPILQGKLLKPFVDAELLEKSQPIRFHTPQGSAASGYRAEILPNVCEVFLKARDAGVLQKQQEHIAARADILIRGLATVGIIALVDEATGYQEIRARDALAEILEAFIKDEAGKWAKRFPDEFYRELFRLKDLDWPFKKNPPQYVGHWTNDIIYKRLAPGVLDDLRQKNPRTRSGRRKTRFHQWLTDDIGHPKLQEHIQAVLALMRASDDWDQFKKMLNRALPKQPQTATERAQKNLGFAD